jgi:hypothetical protein
VKTSYIAGCLVISLVGAELCEANDFHFLGDHLLSLEPRTFNTLAGNPHTHFELDTEFRPTTVAPISVSGGQQAEEMFRLFIYPASSGFKLIGQPTSPEPAGRAPQPMYGFYPTVESLTEVLSANADVSAPQLEAIHRIALEGGVQEIGGSHSPVIRLFRRRQLERLGMNFRPVD